MHTITSLVSPAIVEEFRRDLRLLEREVVRQLQSETACCGVTLAQCHVMLELSRAGTMSLGDLAGALQLDPSTLSRTVDGLARAGLVSRAADPDDRRAVRLACTREGLGRVAVIDEACNRKYAALLASAPPPQRQQIIDAVRFLARGIQELRRPAAGSGPTCCAPDTQAITGPRPARRRGKSRTPGPVSRRSR